MKAVKILLQNRELERFALDRPTVFIGRSPSCDVVLRVPGLRPLHFLLEWVGEGNFDPDKGLWTLLDLSANQKDQARGEGVILSSTNPTSLGDYTFTFVEAGWIEQQIARGGLRRQIDREQWQDGSGRDRMCLELVAVRTDSDRVENVVHIPSGSAGGLAKAGLPARVRWPKLNRAELEFLPDGLPWTAKNRSETLWEGARTNPERMDLSSQDVLIFSYASLQYFLRLVPQIRPARKWSLRSMDASVFLLLLIFLLTYWFSSWVVHRAPVTVAPPEPPRVVRVQVPPPASPRARPQPIVDSTKPNPVPAQLPPSAAAPQPRPTPASGQKSQDSEASAQRAAPRRAAPSQDRSNSARKDQPASNALTILQQGRSSAKPLRADQIVAGRPASRTDSESGGVAVARSQVGSLRGTRDGTGTAGPRLDTAGQKIAGGFAVQKSEGSLEGKESGVLGGRGLMDITGTGSGLGTGTGVGSLASASAEVEGGLDADAVRRAIREYQRQFRSCYENALTVGKNKEATGRVTLLWVVQPDGKVRDNKVDSTTFKEPLLSRCIRGVVDGISFPKAANGKPTRVRYPFIFQGK